jgi:hypothetical protein
MILSSHAVVGAALASLMPSHPAAAFAVGFASHFALDAIPHSDYRIRSGAINPKVGAPLVLDRALLLDLLTIGGDGLLGLVAALLLFAAPASLWAVLLGALGAMLPDPLQVVHAHFPHEPLNSLQRFHRWAHSDKKVQGLFLGFGSQAAFVAAVAGLISIFNDGAIATAVAMVR